MKFYLIITLIFVLMDNFSPCFLILFKSKTLSFLICRSIIQYQICVVFNFSLNYNIYITIDAVDKNCFTPSEKLHFKQMADSYTVHHIIIIII